MHVSSCYCLRLLHSPFVERGQGAWAASRWTAEGTEQGKEDSLCSLVHAFELGGGKHLFGAVIFGPSHAPHVPPLGPGWGGKVNG